MGLRVVTVIGPASVGLKDLHISLTGAAGTIGKVATEDVAVLILEGTDVVVTNQVLGACAEAGVAVICTGPNHMPAGVSLPISGHSEHTGIIQDQIDATAASKKRAWQAIVRGKIVAQAALVSHLGHPSISLKRLVAKVRSGDPDNVEATAAARYFDLIFGKEFVRERTFAGANACLNYGYAIVRACMARAIVGAGLHPALGIFHHNRYNGFCLADDAMEPLRPLVDQAVVKIIAEFGELAELTPIIKRRIVQVVGEKVLLSKSEFPFLIGLERYAANLRRSICESEPLVVPIPVFSRNVDGKRLSTHVADGDV